MITNKEYPSSSEGLTYIKFEICLWIMYSAKSYCRFDNDNDNDNDDDAHKIH